MPAKIRLQRRGKKGQAFFHIVIADGRAPRDGRFIEKIGYYNPLTKPAEIEINFDSALRWLQNGAQPTDTVRAILSYKGVIYKKHLLKGVDKGAMTPEQAEEKFQTWLREKESKIASTQNEHALKENESLKAAMAHEQKVNEAKAQILAKKYAKAQEEIETQPAEETPEAESLTEDQAPSIVEETGETTTKDEQAE